MNNKNKDIYEMIAYKSNFDEWINDKIDRERNRDQHDDIEPGIVFRNNIFYCSIQTPVGYSKGKFSSLDAAKIFKKRIQDAFKNYCI